MKKIIFLLLISNIAIAQKDYTKLVNPFIGTGGHGHTYPGATSPFGSIQLSPDTRMADWDGSSGYHYSDSIIYGFSHTHLSGTGIPDYCDILFQPSVGKYEWQNKNYASAFTHKNEKAYAGYYAVHLDKYDIDIELTTSVRTGMHRYHFPKSSKEGNVLIDLIHRDEVLDSYIQILSDGSVIGYRFSKSWAENQKIYFAARFNKKIIRKEIRNDGNIISEEGTKGKKVQAYFTFENTDGKPLEIQVSTSAISTDFAMFNLTSGDGEFNFDKTHQKNIRYWNEALSKIKIESFADNNIDTTFYTALYHMMVVPNNYQDVNGRYRGTDDKIHKAESYNKETAHRNNYTVFSLWDTYRAYHPLMSIIEKSRTLDWIHTFLNQYKHGGMLPVWELSANETYCMIGYHSVPVIVNAYKNCIIDFDTKLALEAMLKYSNSNKFGISKYVENGFLDNITEAESVSKTMEYAYDDWCIAEFANLLGKKDIAKQYYERSNNYRNLYNPATGFFQGKLHAAWYKPFYPEEINNFYTEGNAWHYSLAAPHDINGIINLYGGREKFTTHLVNLFSTKNKLLGREQADVTGLIGQYAHGNEPSHHMAYMFNYSNLPSNAAYYVNKICKEFYTNKPDGLIGNEDCGQMSAWYVWSCLGMYPANPAGNVLCVGSPQIKNAEIALGNGKLIKIVCKKYDKNSFNPVNTLVNNKKIKDRQINISDIINGGTLKFNLINDHSRDYSIAFENNKITGKKTLTSPFVANASNKFYNSLQVELKSVDNQKIKYQLSSNASINPNFSFKLFEKPLIITENCYIHFYSTDGINKSKITSQPFYKIKDDKLITIINPPHPMYTAGGAEALIDGIKGTENWRAGEWQSYHGINFEAIVDVKAVKKINEISLRFLQDVRSWIWLPRNIKIYGSNDNSNFEWIATTENTRNEKDENVFVEDKIIPINKNYRYLKIIAENFKEIPSWHIGAGDKAHIFISEIDVN